MKEIDYLVLVGLNVFEVTDCDVSNFNDPTKARVADLKERGAVFDAINPETISGRPGQKLQYHFDGGVSVTMRMVTAGSHLYEVASVVKQGNGEPDPKAVDHFLNSLALVGETSALTHYGVNEGPTGGQTGGH
jgi:hypothetical protein